MEFSMSDTKEKILDAAEALFAESGVSQTSLRAITNKAKANLGAIHYYFGNKESLIDEVIDRRFNEYYQNRSKQLKKLLNQEQKPSLEDVLRVFISTINHYRRKLPDFMRIRGHIMTGPKDKMREMYQRIAETEADWLLANAILNFFPAEKHKAVLKRMVVYNALYLSLATNMNTLELEADHFKVELTEEELEDLMVSMMAAGLRTANQE
jgi:AcrR family transcriptional regulator